ncbi:hypothetical protein FVE85_7484 [Porphyridium purpureum]|uniref:Major facilitator superfamily (MFS) profile domain-containing protein n=1 Tax=Porphyridium purpureum TaxID=35688 RepID=A0A5J4Z791_PORPP|nr:hypothetical protein FVE85_7484 [Porphyridium purpureum]|eukprot:POR1982..scf295_1
MEETSSESGESDAVSAVAAAVDSGQAGHNDNEDDNDDDNDVSICTAKQWKALRAAPRELWIIYVLKFLSSYSYFSFALVLVLYLSEEFGLSDVQAGWAYGMYGVMSTVFGMVCGWFIDIMGVRASLIIGSSVGMIARFVLALSRSKAVTLIILGSLLPFAESLGIPIMTIGVKRYSSPANRTIAFSFYYSIMNVAALCAGPAVDVLRLLFGDGARIGSFTLSPDRLVLLTSALSTFLCVCVSFMGIREIDVDERGNVQEFQPENKAPWAKTREVLHQRTFWVLVLFSLLLMGVGMVFRHLDGTMPKYMLREFGPNAPFGLVYSINPFIIIFAVPLVGMVSRRIRSYPMIVYGSFIAGVSPLWVCIGNKMWAIILFVVTLSIGEAIYSPRVYEYSMAISQDGSEGMYSSLASAPLFCVKLLVGGLSGYLLEKFCNEDPVLHPRNSAAMWGIIGAMSVSSAILMRAFKWILDIEEGNPARGGRNKSLVALPQSVELAEISS